jgi:hypothetical protein
MDTLKVERSRINSIITMGFDSSKSYENQGDAAVESFLTEKDVSPEQAATTFREFRNAQTALYHVTRAFNEARKSGQIENVQTADETYDAIAPEGIQAALGNAVAEYNWALQEAKTLGVISPDSEEASVTMSADAALPENPRFGPLLADMNVRRYVGRKSERLPAKTTEA